VAWTIRISAKVIGHAADGETVRIVPVNAGYKGWILLAADAVEMSCGPRPIDAALLQLADSRSALERDHLKFTITVKPNHLERVGVVLAKPELYARLSNLPEPVPTTPSDAYGGWRLP
jgi:hypothetical protein